MAVRSVQHRADRHRADGRPSAVTSLPGLILPRVSARVPAEIAVCSNLSDTAALAEALLAEGVIQEADWQGNIFHTVAAGLGRYMNDELAFRENPYLADFKVFILDEEDEHNEDDYDEDPEDAIRGVPLPAIGLQYRHWGGYSRYTVGRRVVDLEKVKSGLGFAVLGVLNTAFSITVGAWDGRYCMRCMEYAGGIFNTNWAEEAYDAAPVTEREISADDYRRIVPEAALTHEYDPLVVRTVLERELPPWAEGIVRLADQLHDHIRPQGGHPYDDCDQMDYAPSPFLIDWSTDDPSHHIRDYCLHMDQENGADLGSVQFGIMLAFQPDALSHALKRFIAGMEALRLAVRLLDHLKSDSIATSEQLRLELDGQQTLPFE